jgi:beta-glucanase (GH16 family)
LKPGFWCFPRLVFRFWLSVLNRPLFSPRLRIATAFAKILSSCFMRSLFGIGLLLLAASAGAGDWKLIWSDEFDKPGTPDPDKWSYEQGFIRNNEDQLYTKDRPENARVENGMLIIEARKEHFDNPGFNPKEKGAGWVRRNRATTEYTSASLTTRGKASWTYGRIEVRAKLPSGRGVWPAIWMLGTNTSSVGWPAGGEIDIMEFVGFDPGVIHANIHVKKYNHMHNNGKGSQVTIPDASNAFHVYALEWDSQHLDFLVDDKVYFTYTNEQTGTDAWPFDKGQYLILNLAIGGSWGGQQGIDDKIFPQKYYIDYVRVYQKK